jgi:alanyl-tRNA synthetase
VSTDRLYYRDCYLSSFQAKVVDSVDNGRRVYLERTAFYPSSGGQPHDTGRLGTQSVVDVVDEGDRIAHLLAEPLTEDSTQAEIDWHRRYDHMQQHTGQHLLSAVFMDLFAAQTLSFHMGPEVSSIELSMRDLTDAQIDKVEHRANELIWQSRPVNIVFEEAESVKDLRKAVARSGTLRIVEISDLDRSACGGTHVRSTAELGPIQLMRRERVRGNVRLEFVCGGRALRRTAQQRRVLAEISRVASTAVDNLPQHVAGLINRLTEIEKSQQRLVSELARREGEQAYQNTAPSTDGIRRWVFHVDAIDESSRGKAQAFAKLPKALALSIAAEQTGVLIACSADCNINAGKVMKQVLTTTGGRGGGSATLAQGVLSDPVAIKLLEEELGFGLQPDEAERQ